MSADQEIKIFEKRKRDHIKWSLNSSSQASALNGFESVELIHESLPDLDFNDLDITSTLFGEVTRSPFFVSSMTLGHSEASHINLVLAKVCEQNQWPLAVGSQRRQLFDPEARAECEALRKASPNTMFLGNIGVSQLITSSVDHVRALVDSLSCLAMIVHLNPLQECLQSEGTPQFRGGLKALSELCSKLEVPVVVKETGCGMSGPTMARLINAGVSAIDVAGSGGTHWGRIEGLREENQQSQIAEASRVFANWGTSTVESMLQARSLGVLGGKKVEVWASGGVRSGLDAAKLLALGATRIGLAQPFLKAAMASEDEVRALMDQLEYQLKIAMFCTGSQNWQSLQGEGKWKKI